MKIAVFRTCSDYKRVVKIDLGAFKIGKQICISLWLWDIYLYWWRKSK